MTPKEKAIKLVHKFNIDLEPFSEYGHWDTMFAKQCALIAVDELIAEVGEFYNYSKYWEEVKKEIEAL